MGCSCCPPGMNNEADGNSYKTYDDSGGRLREQDLQPFRDPTGLQRTVWGRGHGTYPPESDRQRPAGATTNAFHGPGVLMSRWQRQRHEIPSTPQRRARPAHHHVCWHILHHHGRRRHCYRRQPFWYAEHQGVERAADLSALAGSRAFSDRPASTPLRIINRL